MKVPEAWVSIDPGDKWVGFSQWLGEVCTKSFETTPNGCVDLLEKWSGFPGNRERIISHVVYEKWFLYAWNEDSMAGNEFLTSQLIGMMKYIGNRAGLHMVPQSAAVGKAVYKTTWYRGMKRADKVRMPWWGQLKNGDHAKDSWAHGIAFISECRRRR